MGQQTDFKSLDKSLRKQRIIDTAIEVFHDKGYSAATLDDVAGRLGLTKAALYHYVASKEELLSTIYLQAIESFSANAYEIQEQNLTPRKKLRLLVHDHITRVITDNVAMIGVFFSEENQLPEVDFKKIRVEQRRYNRVFEKVVEEGIAQGYFRPANAKLQAYAILGMCNWLHRWYKPGKSDQKPEEIADRFVDLLENGYLQSQTQSSEALAKGKVVAPNFGAIERRELVKEINHHSNILVDLTEKLEKLG